MGAAFALQIAAVPPQMPKQVAPLSLDCYGFAHGVGRQPSQSLLEAVVQNQLDGLYETRARLFLGPTLTICARNLWAVGDVPLAVAF